MKQNQIILKLEKMFLFFLTVLGYYKIFVYLLMWENFQILFLVHIFIVDETKFVMSDVSKKKDVRQTLNIRFEVLEILLKVNVKK